MARSLKLKLGCPVLRLLKGGAFDVDLRLDLSAGDRCESSPVLSSNKTRNYSKGRVARALELKLGCPVLDAFQGRGF